MKCLYVNKMLIHICHIIIISVFFDLNKGYFLNTHIFFEEPHRIFFVTQN